MFSLSFRYEQNVAKCFSAMFQMHNEYNRWFQIIFLERFLAGTSESHLNIFFWASLERVPLKTQKTYIRVRSHISFTRPTEMISFIKIHSFESGPFWSIVVLIGYNFIVIRWKSSFHKVL